MTHLTVILLVILSSSVNLSHQSSASCSIQQTRKVQSEFTKCSQKFSDTFYSHEDTATTGSEEHVCELLDNIVNKCVELFSACHNTRDLRRMKDLHIEELLKQYSEFGDLTKCKVVREYRESGRSEPDEGEEVRCDDGETTAAQSEFQQCSHSTSTKMYEIILDLEQPKLETIVDTLCSGLSTIGTQCVRSLSQCFAESDLRQIRSSHLTEMKKFFMSFSPQLSPGSLDTCKILDYTHTEDDDNEETTTTTVESEETTTHVPTTTTDRIQSVERSIDDEDIYDYDYDYEDEEDYQHYNAIKSILNTEATVHSDAADDSTEAAERLQFTRSSSSSDSINKILSVIPVLVSLLLFTLTLHELRL